jgi:hypothetical protein
VTFRKLGAGRKPAPVLSLPHPGNLSDIHIFQSGSAEIDRHLAFRDYLRSHPGVRAEYEALKREVFARHANDTDMNAYNDEKDPWIKRTERLALAWYRQQTNTAATPYRRFRREPTRGCH